MNLATAGFAIDNEWYWRITEDAQSFDVAAAVRDFIAPLARHAKDKFAVTEIAADLDEVRFMIGETPVAIRVSVGLQDRVAISHFVNELNRAIARTGFMFALVVPRRYELRGVLLTEDELSALAGDSALLVPAIRSSWRSMPPAS
jgi:hypothetical protein